MSCSPGAFAYQVCGSGTGRDCPYSSTHQLDCKTLPDLRSPPLVGPETDWIKAAGEIDWAFCPPDKPAVSSRCGSGGARDCKLPDSAVIGIKCRALSPEFFLKDEDIYACAKYGELATCPDGYFMVGSCGSTSGAECAKFGCSGVSDTFVGIQCRKYGNLNDLTWDFSAKPRYELEIISDYNPLVGIITDLDVSLESQASASASASLDFTLEFNADMEVEANLLALFGFPKFGGIFGDDEFVDLDIDAEASTEITFQAAAEAQAKVNIQSQMFAYAVSPWDARRENFVRLVRYRRKKIRDVVGAVKCCGCDRPETAIAATFEESQTGFLALHIKKYPGLDLDTIEGRDFVELYLSGKIVDFERGPRRGFISEQGFFERCWARMFG